MKTVSVGTLESSDCLVTIKPHESLEIEIDTVVHDAFYEHISDLVRKTLKEHGITKAYVIVQDKGALDYAIKARLTTAIKRMRDDNG